MIAGIGTDIVNIKRIEKALNRWGNKLINRILHPEEIKEFKGCKKPAAFLAKRFAGKEAVMKALGTGFSQKIRFKDIQVKKDSLGKPQLVFFNASLALFQHKNITQAHISISDEEDYAIAYAILETSVSTF